MCCCQEPSQGLVSTTPQLCPRKILGKNQATMCSGELMVAETSLAGYSLDFAFQTAKTWRFSEEKVQD